ncbi:hypothetical protein IFM89_008601 [Coptis chinensis]|uniref:Uncharacterized protein n=1 Tax=Coptis chinensis TaxID=261450 RepID=A0A835HK04_9MAGN|nr:hypothetical protein IFM89_008601 [Coptis chinensis]
MLLLRTRQLKAQIVEYNDEVELLKQQEDIKSFIFSAYETKYQHHEVHSNSELMSLIPQLVRDEENIVLTAVPTHQEVEDAVFNMEANNSPGPDGFQPGLISNEQLAFIQGRTGLTGWLSSHKSFSDWPGIKWALSELKPHLGWVVGQGKDIDLWKESWAGKAVYWAGKAVYDCLP